MKKALAIFLALMMILSFAALAACDSGTPDGSAANTDTNSNTDANTDTNIGTDVTPAPTSGRPDDFSDGRIQRMLDNGEEVLVGFAVNDLSDWFQTMCTGIQEDYAALGVNFQYSSYGGNLGEAMTILENYATMGAVQLLVTPPDYETLADFCKQFIDQGIQVVFLQAEPPEDFEMTCVQYGDNWDMGVQMGNMAIHWLDQHYPDAAPGSVKVGCILGLAVPMLARRTEAYQEMLREDGRCDIVFQSDAVMTYDEAIAAAEAGFTVEPDIKLFMAFEVEGGTAVSNYIASLPNVDLGEYCVITCGDSAAARALIDQAGSNDQSCLRGTVIEVSETGKLWDTWWNSSYKPLFGEVEVPWFNSGVTMCYNSMGFEG